MNKLLLFLCILSALILFNSCSKDEDAVPKSDVELEGHYATPQRSFKSYTRTHWYFSGRNSAIFEWQDIVREGGASSRPHIVASGREGRKWYVKGDKFYYTLDGVWQVTTFEYIDATEIVIGGKNYKRIG
jgi:hypothetical protein